MGVFGRLMVVEWDFVFGQVTWTGGDFGLGLSQIFWHFDL